MWKRFLLLAIAGFFAFGAQAQVPEFDKLEMYYAQGHYKKVYRKANRLLDKPEYDFSWVPTFYRSLSMFQLSENEHWRVAHPNALQEARNLFLEVRGASDGQKVLDAHSYEIAALKSDLLTRLGDYKRQGKQTEFEELQRILAELFDTVPTIESEGETAEPPVVENTEFEFKTGDRDEMVRFAMQQLGVPYVWAGNTPSGFDCSGFTSYVMAAYKLDVPRRSSDQYEKSKKVKEKAVQKGDLVFFDNGSGISHVGLVVSEQGEPVVMIHASTSKGIMLTEIDKSEYWSKRLAGYGTYLER